MVGRQSSLPFYIGGYEMTNQMILWLLFKDMTARQIKKYNLDHNLVGINKLTKQQINSWSK